MSRVLIVGCGYVGTALGIVMARAGHEVFGLRRNTWTPVPEEAGIHPRYTDITRPEELAKIQPAFESVVFCASPGLHGVEGYRQLYLEGTRNVLAWLHSNPPRRYLYTGSTGVYAQDDGSLVHETSPAEPVTDTGQVLLQTEQLLMQAWSAHQFPVIIFRIAGIYGPGRGYYLQQFLKGEPLAGPGDRYVNMVHRDDIAGAIVAALEKGRPGEIYNLVDNQPVPQSEIYAWCSRLLGRPMLKGEGRAARSTRAGNRRISNQKLRDDLGYVFRYPSFREGYREELQRLGHPLPGSE